MEFREMIWQRGRDAWRDMPWRTEPTLYYVLVSELMLQRTQVPRVLTKFAEFTAKFPDIESLARADLAEVLRSWQGLGYNRRAKYLHQAARLIAANPSAFTPSQETPVLRRELSTLPGVGAGTLGAIMNYVYEIPTAYVETNIRTVYFHHFYHSQTGITDTELLACVDTTMDREHPREWFWALMDYGSELKRMHGARLDQSRHYRKQAPLKGSVREVRGQLIKTLASRPRSCGELAAMYRDDARFEPAVAGLQRDGLVVVIDGVMRLTNE